jgi:hypothetical protein
MSRLIPLAVIATVVLLAWSFTDMGFTYILILTFAAALATASLRKGRCQ